VPHSYVAPCHSLNLQEHGVLQHVECTKGAGQTSKALHRPYQRPGSQTHVCTGAHQASPTDSCIHAREWRCTHAGQCPLDCIMHGFVRPVPAQSPSCRSLHAWTLLQTICRGEAVVACSTGKKTSGWYHLQICGAMTASWIGPCCGHGGVARPRMFPQRTLIPCGALA